MLPVVVREKLSYIDASGKSVLDTDFSRGSRFRNGHAIVYRGRLPGLMDATGNVTVDLQYDDLRFIDEDLLAFKKGRQWGVCDLAGNVAIAPRFAEIGAFSGGVAAARLKTLGSVSIIERSGSTIIKDTGTISLYGCSEGLVPCRGGKGLYGYRSADGSWAIKAQFESTRPFSEGIGAVSQEVEGVAFVAFIDHSGELLTDYVFESTNPVFSCGRCVVAKPKNREYFFGCINDKFEPAFGCMFDYIDAYSEGVAIARLPGGKKGYIDLEGNPATDFQFDSCEPFQEGAAYVTWSGGRGYIDRRGRLIWETGEA